MTSPITVRLDKTTRQQLAVLARRRKVSASAVIRSAIKKDVLLMDCEASLYDRISDLIGVVDAALVRVAEREGLRTIFTVDKKDFALYRLHDRSSFKIVP